MPGFYMDSKTNICPNSLIKAGSISPMLSDGGQSPSEGTIYLYFKAR